VFIQKIIFQFINLKYLDYLNMLKRILCNRVYFGLLMIINAAITPGTHPHNVKIKTITKDPQPLSKTAKGGNMIDKITLQIFIYTNLRLFNKSISY
tara:strand:- start:3140 stop:3427 length:288 start_codon:yes stop_codon:yes gene_type:complete